MSQTTTARILETGYRPYDGPRFGPRHAVWALTLHTLRRMTGLRRPARYKVLPFAAIAIAYLPAIAFIGIVALIPARATRVLSIVPSPGHYYGFVSAAIILFATFAAPEALCPDRRSGFLGVYLASPLTRTSYLVSKALAVVFVLLLVTLGPPLLLLIGLTLQNAGPRGSGDFFRTLLEIFGAGVSISLMFGALALAVPSLTDRRGFATAGSLLLILGSGALTGVMVFGLHGPEWLLLGSLDRLPLELALRIFALPGLPTRSGTELSSAGVIATSVVVTVVSAGIAWWRVLRTTVTR